MNDDKNRDYWTIEAMRHYGGSFVVQLSALAQRADADNLRLIKETWPEYWKEYEAMGIELEKKAGSIERK